MIKHLVLLALVLCAKLIATADVAPIVHLKAGQVQGIITNKLHYFRGITYGKCGFCVDFLCLNTIVC